IISTRGTARDLIALEHGPWDTKGFCQGRCLLLHTLYPPVLVLDALRIFEDEFHIRQFLDLVDLQVSLALDGDRNREFVALDLVGAVEVKLLVLYLGVYSRLAVLGELYRGPQRPRALGLDQLPEADKLLRCVCTRSPIDRHAEE